MNCRPFLAIPLILAGTAGLAACSSSVPSTGSPSTASSATSTADSRQTSAPTETETASAKQQGYDSCASYATAHNDGTLQAFSESALLLTTNTGAPALDLPITTTTGTSALYLCVMPGYPGNFTVSQATTHDAG